MRRLGLTFISALCMSTLVAVISAQQTAAPVADAARRGDLATVRALLKQGADVSAPHGDGMTPLHWAAERADLAMAEVLLYAGADVAAVTRLGQFTPLHLASQSGSAPVVRALLKAGAKADAKTTAAGATALHLAAASGNAETVTALLDAGLDVNARETEADQTPLHFAAAMDRVEVVTLLASRGANIKAASRVVDIQRQSTIDRAATALQRQVLQASVPRGETPTPTQQAAAVMAARELILTGKAPEPPAAAAAGGGGRGGGGRGGGGGAAAAGPGAAAAPPAGGAPPAAQPATTPPPAAAAPPLPAPAARGGTGGDQAQTTRLNEEGPPPPTSAKGGMTALHYAARQGFVRTARALLDAGAEVNRKTADGTSPILVALINGQFDVAVLFIERGADPNLTSDPGGITPLWAAVNARWQPRTRFPQPQEMELQKATYLEVMEALLKAGADPNGRTRAHPFYMVYTGCGNGNCGLTNTTGSTAFWRASYGTDVDGMRLLVKYGADPNVPTMTAARGGGAGGRAGGGGRGGGGGGGRGGGGGGGRGGDVPDPNDENAQAQANQAQRPGLDPSGLPPVPGGGPAVYPIHAAAGVEYGEGFAGNAHRHAPGGWLPAVKYLVEELGADVNQRDDGGYTPLHHAAARGDNEMILYLVSKGADVKAVSRRNQTTADMANGPVSRISPFPETIALLVKLGAKNNNRCQSCAP